MGENRRCTGCKYCALMCPQEALTTWERYPALIRERCTWCGLCAAACPVECIDDIFGDLAIHLPLSPPAILVTYGHEAKEDHVKGPWDFIIIGSGIGGLLISALLARDGHSVIVLEKLNFIGGKYTSISYRGHDVPTGAHHMFPHGRRSPIYEVLRDLNMDVTIAQSFPPMLWRVNGKEYAFPIRVRDYFRMVFTEDFLHHLLPFSERARMLWDLFWYKMGLSPSSELSVRDLVDRFTNDGSFHRAVDQTVQYALGVRYHEIPGVALLNVFRKYGYVLQAVVRKGMGKLIKDLARVITSHDGTIRTTRKVEKIIVERGEARGVRLGSGETLTARKGVISNAGMRETASLIGQELLPTTYREKIEGFSPAWGITHMALLDTPVLSRGGVVMTGDMETVCAVSEPMKDRPLLLGYQVLGRDESVDEQANRGKKEFLDFCGRLREEDYIMSVFHGRHPGAEIAAVKGQVGSRRIGHSEADVRKLWIIGADCVGMGIAGDMVGDSVRTLYSRLRAEL